MNWIDINGQPARMNVASKLLSRRIERDQNLVTAFFARSATHVVLRIQTFKVRSRLAFMPAAVTLVIDCYAAIGTVKRPRKLMEWEAEVSNA